MPKLTPQEQAAKWSKNLSAAGPAYAQGIQRVQVNPAQQAIAAQEQLVANFLAAVQSGKWARGLSQVTLGGWKQAAVEKGQAALANAARVAQDKVARVEAVMGPKRDAIVASLPPRGDINQNLERARLMALGMHDAAMRG